MSSRVTHRLTRAHSVERGGRRSLSMPPALPASGLQQLFREEDKVGRVQAPPEHWALPVHRAPPRREPRRHLEFRV